MHKSIIAALIGTLAFYPVCGLARVPYRLPPGTRLQTPKGTFQGYTLEEMKIILKIDTDLEFADNLILKYKDTFSLLEQQIASQKKMLSSKDVQIDLSEKDRKRLTEKWSKENEDRLKCENAPKVGNWLAWGIAIALGTLSLSLGITLIVKEYK